MELTVRNHDRAPGLQPVEVVERKGLGHPDTLCDGIAESVSRALCREYLARFGVVLHHNVDKVLLCGGASRPAFGGGEIVAPIEIYLAGRATDRHHGVAVPVHDIAVAACKDWLRATLRHVDVGRDVRIVSRLRPGSSDLARLFARGGAVPLANDSSCGAGFAPRTDLERVVLGVDQALRAARDGHPEIGDDVKILGVRRGRRIELTIATAFVGRFLGDLGAYRASKHVVRALAIDAARVVTAHDVEAAVNVGDDIDRGDIYLTVAGTSAEAGDDGEVGRGNRTNGLITPFRPMTIEAAAGKNPVSHVGKLYHLVASRIAEAVHRDVGGVVDVACVLVSRIGHPIDDPLLADVSLVMTPGTSPPRAPTIHSIVQQELGGLGVLRDELLAGRVSVF